MTDQERARIHAQLDVLLGTVPRAGILQRQAEYQRLDTNRANTGAHGVPGGPRLPYPSDRANAPSERGGIG